MKYFDGTKPVPGGFYLDRKSWAVAVVNGPDGLLPPGAYVKLPVFLALLAGPVLGGALVLFLPLVGIALALEAAWAAMYAKVAYALPWRTARKSPTRG